MQMMQPATIAVPAQAVPIPQPPIQQTAPSVKLPQPTPSRGLLPEPPAKEPEQV